MKTKFLLNAIAACLIYSGVHSQEVSTMVYDPDKRFEAMHWHEDGRIYSVDYYNGRLYQIHPDGTVETLLSGFSALAGGGFDAAGNFYVAGINSGEILLVNEDNSTTSVASGFSQPVSVFQSTSDPDLFYVSEWQTNKLSTFSMLDGEAEPFVVDNGLNGPDGIVQDWFGDLLVANWNNHKIHRITPEGEVSLFSTLPAFGNMGYITLLGDHVYVPSVSDREVYRIDQSGNPTLIAGTGSIGSEDGPALEATFTSPNGICHNQAGDSLLIGDRHRIRVLTGFNTEVGVSEKEAFVSLQLSPNPAQDYLDLTWSTEDRARFTRWDILDSTGRVVCFKEGKSPSYFGSTVRIDLGGLKSGAYILRISDKSGVGTEKRFVKL